MPGPLRCGDFGRIVAHATTWSQASADSLPGEARASVADDQHRQVSRAVDAFDAVELDVARRRWPANPGQRSPRIQTSQGIRDAVDDLIATDDAEVIVGEQAQGAAALVRAGVEDDRAGLGATFRSPRRLAAAERAAGLAGRFVGRSGRIGRWPAPGMLGRWLRFRDLRAPARRSFRAWWRSTGGDEGAGR